MSRTTFKKVITSEENLEKINPKNKKMAERFLKEKDTRSSDGTIENYRSDLNIFFTWNLLENDNKFFVDIKKIEFSDFFSYCMSELKWGSARFSRMRSCLSSFSNFIEKYFDEDYPMFRNVILKAIESMPKTYRREKTILSDEQLDSLLKKLVDGKKYQMACWLALAISSGARFSELLRFDIDIINEENLAFDDIFIETMKPIKTKGRTKEGKVINKYIIKELFLPYYKLWLPERESILLETGQKHNKLFIRKDGLPIESGGIRNWIEHFEKELGIPFYPHCLRHYTTTYLSRIGLPDTLIKEIFGWASVDMVEIYTDLTAKDRKWEELGKLKEHLSKK